MLQTIALSLRWNIGEAKALARDGSTLQEKDLIVHSWDSRLLTKGKSLLL